MYPSVPPLRDEEENLLSRSQPQRSTAWRRSSYGRFLSCVLSPRMAAVQCLAFMRPSFLNHRLHGSASSANGDASSSSPLEKPAVAGRRKVHATEYLDGVRGVASLIVFCLHWSHIPYPSVNSGWGYDEEHRSFWLLPFVRLIYSGAAMVSIFFVVSGFVLSHRFIQRMHRREYDELFAGLTSITWRRALRLFLPAFVSSLMAFVCACLGVISIPNRVDGKRFHHSFESYLSYLDSESNPWDWSADFFGFYNPQLWSIAVEFRGSMVVFLLIAALNRTKPLVRLAIESFLVIHCFGHKRWDVALFIAGMVIAELEVMFQKSKMQPSRRRVLDVILVITLVLGIFLSGYPRDHNLESPGYTWTAYVWPITGYRRRFWLAISAIMIVGPMAFLPSIQSLFTTGVARYLGRISFALYLTHGLGNKTIGKWLLNTCWDYIGKDDFWPYACSFIISSAIYFPIIVWFSDMFMRAVDIPSTNLARWLEKRASQD
ncbi:acyltransferase family-domain-containing protein [Xylariales sp. PMI_506]|nr:acyltransferase family-domain-containing protein [Xylariales sp. PMI_506]